MIVVAELKKPCTDKARADFIVENNHNKCYQIKETKTKIQALDYDDTEKAEQEQIEKDKLEQQEAAAYLNELKELAQSAQLMGDSEWYAEIQAEYQSIVNGE